MFNRLPDLARLRASVAAQVQPVARVGMDFLRDVALGEPVRAQVVAALSGGLYSVLIERQPFTLRLPVNAQAGDVLQLVVSAREPQLKFELAALDEPDAVSARLSNTARFITDLLMENENLPMAARAPATAPLLAAAPVDRKVVAAVLQRALTQSGIFYESHQAQWVAGERPLASLRQEPQGALAPLRSTQSAQPGASPVVSDPFRPNHADQPELPSSSPREQVHRDALAIVRQQLDTLATQHVVWSGLIWPGQPMHWEIAEQTPRPQELPQDRIWRTRLRLDLPRLGAIDAALSFTAQGVHIALQAGSADAMTMLAAHGPQLQQSLLGAGITSVSVTVNADGAA